MNNKVLLVLAGLIVVSVLSPVSAEKIILSANGTLDEYDEAIIEARIFTGSWTLKVAENGDDFEVDFRAFYLEENVAEENVGTLDKFRLVLTQLHDIDIDGSECTIWGTLSWQKIGWDSPIAPGQPYDPPGKPRMYDFSIDAMIIIEPTEMSISLVIGEPPSPIPFFEGTTLSFNTNQ